MTTFSRRSFLAGSAALAAAPAAGPFAALGAVPASGDVDILIVGAGAAGLAAATRVAAAKQRFALIEAKDRAGGRCVTDTQTFGAPFDRGAHWIHRDDDNPLVKLKPDPLEVYRAPRSRSLRVGPRPARDSELERYFSHLVRSARAIMDAGHNGDVPAASALPPDLDDWRAAVEFTLGPYSTGKPLAQVSALDFARAGEREGDAFCRQGYGALLAAATRGIPVQTATPVTRFSWGGALEAQTPRGRIRARAAIVTVSTDVLAGNGIAFDPDLPARQRNACARLSLGSYEHIALEIPGNPFGLEVDDLVFEKSSGPRTAALLANIGGSALCTVEVAGPFGRELARAGEADMLTFARDWLSSLFGASAAKAIKRSAVTRWSEDPFTRGAFSAAAPGSGNARRILMEPLRDRVFFAGEAVHNTLFGTVGGAWESGTRAAELALRQIGALTAPKPHRETPKKPRRTRKKR